MAYLRCSLLIDSWGNKASGHDVNWKFGKLPTRVLFVNITRDDCDMTKKSLKNIYVTRRKVDFWKTNFIYSYFKLPWKLSNLSKVVLISILLLFNLNFEMFQKWQSLVSRCCDTPQIDKIGGDVRRKVSRNWDILSALNKYFYDFIIKDISMIVSEIWNFVLFCKINKIGNHKIL